MTDEAKKYDFRTKAVLSALDGWDGVDYADLLELLAKEFGISYEQLVDEAVQRLLGRTMESLRGVLAGK